ncbi:hypothetical protein [Parapedobacter koreensis]|nr:hypothetical protein [Parapedobacter koreensis]
MKITPALLTKYHLGCCSAAEEAFVRQWLDGAVDAQTSLSFGDENEEDVRRQLWKGIAPVMYPSDTMPKRRSHMWRSIRLAAAASMIFVMGGILAIAHYAHSRVVIDNRSGESAQLVYVGGLQIEVAAHSSCAVSLPWFGREGSLDFQGAVAVTNPTSRSRNLRISTGMENGDRQGKDRVHLHGGQRYLAVDDVDCQFVAATDDELLDGIPMGFKSKLAQRFSL